MTPDIEAIQPRQKLAMFNTGEVFPIHTFFDADGDDTDDPAEALSFTVFHPPTNQWHTAPTAPFYSNTRH